MSFSSNYLKLRQEREGNSTNNAGGSMPPASSGNTSSGTTTSNDNSFSSNYLALREKRNSMTISEKVEKRVQALQQKRLSSSSPADILNNAIRTRSPSGTTTSGGYYSRPNLGSLSEKLYSNVTALDPVLTEKRSALDTAHSTLKQAESDLQTVRSYLDQAKATYDADPTDANATSYNQIVGAYNLAYDSYTSAFDAYSAAYNDYKPYEDQMVDAIAVYQLYNDQQQTAFDEWRGTIRDVDTISAEMDQLDSEIQKVESEISALKTLTRFRSDALGQTMKQSLQEAEVNLEALQKSKELLQEEYDWSQYYKYNDLRQAADFAEKSQYASTANGQEPVLNSWSGMYSETGFDDLTYDYINRNEEARGKALVNSIGDNSALLGLDTSYLEQMTDDEISIFNYLYATQGADAAYAYTAYLTSDLTQRQRMEQEADWAAYAQEHPVKSSVFSTLISPMKSLSYLGQVADYVSDGTIDQNAAYNKYSYAGSAIRNQVSRQIEKSGKWGPIGSFAYQTAMSMADFLWNAGISGGNQVLSLAIMGTGAAADATIAAKDRGLSDSQAFWLGTVAGAAEIATERCSLEALLNPDLLKDGVKNYILKNMWAEGSEEAASDAINYIADMVISKDKSEWKTSIDTYVEQGMSLRKAVRKTIVDEVITTGIDALGGAISGGIMSGVNAGVHVNFTNKLAKQLANANLSEDDIQAFIEEGLNSEPETAAYQRAVAVQAKVEAGETLSNSELAWLWEANMQAIQEEEESDNDFSDDAILGDNRSTGEMAGEEAEPEWVRLRTLDDETDTGEVSADTMLTQAKADLKAGKISDAEFDAIMDEVMHLEELEDGTSVKTFDSQSGINEQADNINVNVNGGTTYDNTQRPGRPADSQRGDGSLAAEGNNLLHGSGQRYDGPGAGEQAGGLAGRAGQTAAGNQKGTDASRTTIQRQNIGANLRTPKVSSLQLGLTSGTETARNRVVPQEYWDESMAAKADQVHQETGKEVSYVLGSLEFRNARGYVSTAQGAIVDDRIIVQADNYDYTAEQIADHEAYHGMRENYGQLLNDGIVARIREQFTRGEFDKVLDAYIDQLCGIYDLNNVRSDEEYEKQMRGIVEELLADAHAGMNMWGAGATQFTETVNQFLEENHISRKPSQENGTAEATGPPEEKYSISDISGERTDYGEGVILDTNLFAGARTRDWGKVLGKYVYENLAGAEFTVYAENGQLEVIEFARLNDRVWKDGAKNGHKVIDKLARYRGDNVKALATVHLPELLATSRYEKTTDEHSHQWMDENGWELRTAYFQDRNGNIYEATLNIANGRDRRILYAISNVRHIDKNRAARGDVPSTVTGRGSLTKSNSTSEIVADKAESVKERFSYAGENAQNADMEALARAKEMRSAGVADETIRQQTGWHTGMDGKWRWEIDDSGMRYDSSGDLRGAESAKWAMEDYESARDDLWGRADMDTLDKVRAYNRADIAGDSSTKQALYDELINGPHAYYFDQYVEAMARAKDARNAPEGGTLQDYIDHPTLFEAYPRLKDVQLRFERMGGGNMGYYSRTDNEIVLNSELRYAAEDTLVHEIQHAIQKAEGFARGSNEEYWKQRQDSDDAVHVYDDKIQDSDKKVDEIMRQLPPNVAEQFRRWSALDESSPEAMDLMQKFWDGPYSDAFEDYWFLTTDLEQMNRNNYKRGPRELYMNTAGEIEARDSASRRNLTPEQRRSQEPARGDSSTVFMEDVDELALAEMDAEYGPQMQAVAEFDQNTISSNIQRVAQMESVASVSGQEFAKGEVDLITQVERFFNERDNRAYSPELGEVILDRKGVKSDIAHGIGRKKAAAFAAVPDVIERGLVVDYQKDWKGRGYDTAVVAAPITISDKIHMAATILLRSDQTNRFYVHEVLAMENGALPFKTGTREGYPGGDAPSVLSILDRIRSVKNQNTEYEKFSVEEISEARSNMTTKERDILRGVEMRLLRDIGGALGVTKFGDRNYLKGVIQRLSDTYLETGTIDQQTMDDLFEQAYRQGIVVDRELHDQYEEVRKYLRTVSLTLDPRDRSDIADYPDFVKRMRGRVRIVNEGGLPVDSAWHELNDMAPELFPESIAHPADQLVRMTEVLGNLQVTEKSLGDYYGSMASTYKKDAKTEFERAVWDSIGELRQIRRYEQERQQKQQVTEPAPTTPEEAMEAWTKLKAARKTYEKSMAKNLLTTEDEIAVGELLKGKMLPEHLDKDKPNVKGVLAVYEAKQEYERLTKLLAEYRRKVKADIRSEADTYLETANTWKDKSIGLAYSREIMQRNVEDIVPDKKLAKAINERYFEPVRDAEAAAVKMKEEYREKVRKLNLSRKVQKGNLVSEAHAVQLYGEAMDNIRILENTRSRLKHRDGKSLEEWRGVVYKLWQENPGLNKAKIENSIVQMRQIYDELFQKMNEVRIRWGYEPVNYRQGYFPHFQPGNGDGIMAQFGRVLGIDTQVVALPTTINGLTHTFKPGIQWFGNAQERLGFNTAYDAVEGFDRYIEGVASVICETENIQRLRALASQIRYRTSDEGIRKQVDAIYSNSTLTEEQKNDAISGIYEKGRYTLSNFVVEVDEYTNLLANKKSKLDRTVEALIGRKFYTCMKWLESRVGANMIAGNMTSALTNVIPLTQARAQLGDMAMLKGIWHTLASYKTDDGIIDRSSFLTNRRGSDPLVKAWSAKVSEVLGTPMELIDNFTSGSIVRAAYYQNLKQGLSESEAMHQADIFASRVMAERSKGGMPTLFEAKNPLFKLVTQFQLEVNNQWSEVFKDIPRSQREKGLGALALVFLQYFLGAWLFNNLYEKWIGRRPAMDPIDIVLDAARDFTSDDVSTTDALGNLANNVLEELPFSSALTLVGIETDGGRVPVSSGIPNIPTLVTAATNEDWAPEKRWKEAQDELNKLAYVIPPFGGNQVSKIWKGIKAYIEGGSYSADSEGNDILQYPVYNDESGDFWGLVQAMLLGKSALPEAQAWVEDGFDSLSAKQTAVYQDMVDAGVSEREAYDLIDSLRSADETDEMSKKEAQIKILSNADATDECKAIAFYGLLATDNERMLMDSLTDVGALPGAVMDTLILLRDAAALPSAQEKQARADILIGSALTEGEKEVLIRSWLDDQEVNESGNLTNLGKFNFAMKQGITTDEYITWIAITEQMKSGEKAAELASWDLSDDAKQTLFRNEISDSREDSITAFQDAGLSFDQFLEAYSKYGEINNMDLDAGMKAVEFSHWVNEQGYTSGQAAVVKDELTYFNMTPASSSRYDELVGAGMDPDDAYDLTGALNNLQPEAGEDEVTDLQKWRASVDFSDDIDDQLAALSAVMTDAQFQKVDIANNFGVTPDAYVMLQEIKPRYDVDGNGTYKNAEIQAAIDGMTGYYTTEQKAVLWQLATGSTSAKNNPYSRQVGQQVLDAREAAKAEAAVQAQSQDTGEDDDSFSQELLNQLLGRG